ncbi:DUF5011 domain-containing protein [Anaerocolumna sp. AGMB13020]|uniref:immunoglobulin-like domain-containing protein n=1 Tax=Anaerocolumna sp. AGMB13020 TaxID=3081750 RepID=UPI002954D5C9|nr:immunoglobulin-like domain-containing protein [Anaerocolumna sp. AGMB13020]WOO38840.1 DUF5011 domain-containing protein [Anaerocolumna sp. AGMB13020]
MKKFIILSGIITSLLFAMLIYIVVKEDKTAPVIHINNESLVYREGEDTTYLLQGITAEDDIDGDVTATVMVGDLITMPDGTAAKITYLAKDSSNNVGQLDILIPYEAAHNNKEAFDKGGEAGLKETGQSTVDTITADSKKEASSDYADKKKPVIELLSTEITLNRGEEFDPKAYIKNISDDKDSVQTLLDSVTVTGTYNMNKRGTYPVILTAQDSEGNQSDKVSLILKVE